MAELEARIDLMEKEGRRQKIELVENKRIGNYIYLIALLVLLLAYSAHVRYRTKHAATRALAREVEKHRESALQLAESEEKSRILTEKSAVGICIIYHHQIEYVNPRLEDIFGYAPGELTGRDFTGLVVEADRPRVREQLNRRLAGETDPGMFEFRGLHRTGRELHLESYGNLTQFRDRPAILKTVIDVTDRKKMEQELLKMRKLESVGILAGGIARDFLQILSTIDANTRVLEEAVKDKPPMERMLANIKKNAAQSSDLARRLITLSGTGEITPGKVLPAPLIQNATAGYPEMENLDIALSLAPDLRPLRGDERQLSRVLASLLWNAREACNGQGISVTILGVDKDLPPENEFSLPAGAYVLLSVTDNGKGIPPQHLDKIFDPYFSTKSTYKQKGLGLGLAISYSVVKRHGGHISVHSEEGRGTTVQLIIPAYPPEPGEGH